MGGNLLLLLGVAAAFRPRKQDPTRTGFSPGPFVRSRK